MFTREWAKDVNESDPSSIKFEVSNLISCPVRHYLHPCENVRSSLCRGTKECVCGREGGKEDIEMGTVA